MATTTFSTILQRGSYNRVTGIWTENGGLYNKANSEAWLVYDVASLVGQLSTDATTMDFEYRTNGIGAFRLDLLVLNRPLLAPFSATNLPTGRAILADSVAFTTVAEPTDNTIQIPLRTSTGAATPFLSALKRTDSSDTVRRFAMGIRVSPSSGIVAVTAFFGTTANLTLSTETPEFTGLEGPYQAYGRADECPKCGLKSTRDTWVRDGYSDMMVCANCYDEEDRVGRHYQGLGSERPGQGEG